MKTLFLTIICLLLSSTSAFSQGIGDQNSYLFSPFFDFYTVNYLSSKEAGKGFTGIAGDNDISGTILNPASLELKNKFQVYGEYIFKSNASIEPYYSDGLKELHPTMLAGIGYKISKDFSVGVLYENEKSFKWDLGPVTNEFGEPTGDNVINDFSISSVSVPIVYDFVGILKFGVNLNYNFYSSEYTAGSRSQFNRKESFQKFIPDFGIIYKPIKSLSFGAVFTPQTSEIVEVVYTDTIIPNETYSKPNYFPLKFGFGIDYTFDKTPLTISADYNFENTSTDDNLTDRNDFNFGLEYIINKTVTVRTGFFTLQDMRDFDDEENFYIYPDPGSYSQTFGTIGATFNINEVNLNLSILDSHLFSAGRIEQTQVNFGIGYDFK
ncbi:MAG: hypothetical protein IPL53_23085 [Ignavibacteria bacterium]|nr:hypothetical protein [Ignavibacteria bacterium]